jgi:glycosyltransferase involved in cell wall biosynthesis
MATSDGRHVQNPMAAVAPEAPTELSSSAFIDMWTAPDLPFATIEQRRQARPVVLPRISAVIPAMNEAENLPHVLCRLPEIIDEVILIDGHSTDDTIAVARKLLPEVRVVTQTHRGKGNALACGFAVATGDIIVMLDADGSTDPAEIPLFIAELRDGADFVKGSRYLLGGASEDLTHTRRAGNAFLTHTVNTLFGVHYTDLCYGYMAFWRRCLPQLAVDCTGFEVETLLTLRAVRAELKVAEVPSVERNRIHGEGNLRPVHDGLRVMRTILRERFKRDRTAAHAPAWAALTGGLDDVNAVPDDGVLNISDAHLERAG